MSGHRGPLGSCEVWLQQGVAGFADMVILLFLNENEAVLAPNQKHHSIVKLDHGASRLVVSCLQ